MATEEFSGPIDYLVFSFPNGASVGKGLTALLKRVNSGHIEILDLEFVRTGDDGTPQRLSLDEIAGADEVDLSEFEGADSGILDVEDLGQITALLQPGEFALAVVYEDRSLAEAAAAWSQVGGTELVSGGVDIDELAATLDALEGDQS